MEIFVFFLKAIAAPKKHKKYQNRSTISFLPGIKDLLIINKLNLFSTRKNKNSSNRKNIEIEVINKSR